MPLLQHEYLVPEGELGIWGITESEDWFLSRLDLYEAETAQLATIKGHRRLEWLAGRYLLHQLSGRTVRGAFLKDEYGKPHLEDSTYHVSLSHSHNKVALIAGPQVVGVDIQFIVAKIERIAHKYMRDIEMDSLAEQTRLEQLHVYWGAKEALYKCYGKRQLDFRQHIHITPFDYSAQGGTTTGQVVKEDFSAHYQIYYRKDGEFILVSAIDE